MCDDKMDATLSLEVIINKEENKVLYAVADNHFADILLSFLTLPLGRIIKILEKQYGDEAPTIGSLTTLYNGLANLDAAHFVTEAAKKALLNPTSSFQDKNKRLKVDITDSPPAEYFGCGNCSHNVLRNVSRYYDEVYSYCKTCRNYTSHMSTKVVGKRSEATSSGCVFTKHKATFLISEDLQILPYERELSQISNFLGITGTDKTKTIQLNFGFNEVMDLLKAAFTSPTPLLDLLLKKKTQMNSAAVESQQMMTEEVNPKSRDYILKCLIQESTGKLVCAQVEEDFVEYLFSLLLIPVGGVEKLVGGSTCIKAIDNLYSSTADLMDDKFFKSSDMKKRLMQPNLVHGCISDNHILPLTHEPLPAVYSHISRVMFLSSTNFPKGKGCYLKRPQTYEIKDDLTVTPFCFVSMLSCLNKQKIPLSDVKQVELQIGLKECLSILKTSLTSTSALTDALLTQISNKQPK